MNRPLRKMTVVALLLATGTLVSVCRAAAVAPKPALTITCAGYDKLMNGLKVLDGLSGRAKLAAKAEAQLVGTVHGKDLAGLDRSRPFGALLSAGKNDEWIWQIYIPVTDMNQLFSSLPGPEGKTPAANAKGVYEFLWGDETMYATQKGPWAVCSFSEEGLDSAPADPIPAFGDLPAKYLVSLRGSVQDVPVASRKKFLEQLRGIVKFAIDVQQQSASDDERAIMAANVQQIFAGLTKLSNELDTAVVGVGLEASSKALFLDFELRGVEGSDLAKKFNAQKDAKTDFGGFALPGAAMTLLAAGTSDDEDVKDSKAALETYRANLNKFLDGNEDLTGDQRAMFKKLLGDILAVVEKTVELKKSDAGMAIVLDDGLTAVAGIRIAEGEKLEVTLKKLVAEIAADDPKLAKMIEFDAEKHDGVNFHVAKIPLDEPLAAEVYGNPLQIVIGTGPSSLYLGAGKAPLATIKKAMDGSKTAPGKAIDALEMVVSGTPIAKFFARIIPPNNPDAARAKKTFAKAAEALEKSGQDHVTMTVRTIPNGMTARLKVESGITQAVLDLLPGIGAGEPDEN